MKTKEQIAKYASQCCFPEDDWQKVLDYCRERFGGGRIHKAMHPLSQSTYSQFLDWVDNGFGVGDVVRYGHTLGIVGAYTPGYTCLAVYLSSDKELIEQKMEIFAHKIIAPTQNDVKEMDELLKLHGVYFSVSLACLMKSYQPINGDIVRVSAGTLQTTGIFRVNDGTNFYFYAYVFDDKIIKDRVVSIGDVTISRPTKTDVERLQIALAKNKLEWSARHKTLRAVENLRAAKGGKYWYFSERFSVCADIDMYTKKHDDRHKIGNYFCSYGDAVLFMQKVKEFRKEIAGMK